MIEICLFKTLVNDVLFFWGQTNRWTRIAGQLLKNWCLSWNKWFGSIIVSEVLTYRLQTWLASLVSSQVVFPTARISPIAVTHPKSLKRPSQATNLTMMSTSYRAVRPARKLDATTFKDVLSRRSRSSEYNILFCCWFFCRFFLSDESVQTSIAWYIIIIWTRNNLAPTFFVQIKFVIICIFWLYSGWIRTRLARSMNLLNRATLVFCWPRNMSAKPCLPAIRIIDPTARLKILLPLWSDSRYVNR